MSNAYVANNSGGGGGSGIIQTIAGDVGSITGANVTVFTNNATEQAGSTVLFNNSGTVSTLVVTDANNNTIMGKNSGNPAPFSILNTGFGVNVLSSITTASANACFGSGAGQNITDGDGNTAIGPTALNLLQVGGENTAIGGNALRKLNDPLANSNTACGGHVYENLLTGINNAGFGNQAGQAYSTNESNNITILNQGLAGDQNTIRIGTELTQTRNFQAGINGNTVSNQAYVTIDSVTGQLGTLPTPPTTGVYFQAYLTAPQTINTSTETVIIFDTPITNIGSAYDPSTGIFTAPSTGFYGFSCVSFFHNMTSAVGNTMAILGYLGSAQSLRVINQGAGCYALGNDAIFNASWQMPMNAGDTLAMEVFADGTGTYEIFGAALTPTSFNTASTFSGYLIA